MTLRKLHLVMIDILLCFKIEVIARIIIISWQIICNFRLVLLRCINFHRMQLNNRSASIRWILSIHWLKQTFFRRSLRQNVSRFWALQSSSFSVVSRVILTELSTVDIFSCLLFFNSLTICKSTEVQLWVNVISIRLLLIIVKLYQVIFCWWLFGWAHNLLRSKSTEVLIEIHQFLKHVNYWLLACIVNNLSLLIRGKFYFKFS